MDKTTCRRFTFGLLFLIILTLLLAGCSGRVPGLPGGNDSPVFHPPTLPPVTVTLPATPAATQTPHPTPTPPCKNDLKFQEDLTIPDGTEVTPGQQLDKRWQVLNSGTCNWDEKYRVKLLAGPEMGAAKEQALYPARSGTQAVLRMLFTAPSEPGTYRSAWQAYTAEGEPFGEVFFVEVVVK
jgi:hypothetical protein